MKTLTRHPARYTDALLPIFAQIIPTYSRGLDPFGGTGKIFEIERYVEGVEIECVEIEPEWAAYDNRITVGDALALPWGDGYFDWICTSPTYGNRMADHHEARDCSKRNTYRHALNRPLHPANAGQLQYGAEYQKLHRSAWAEAWRVLRPGGLFILNIKDHIRRGERVNVTQFHEEALRSVGFTWLGSEQVKCPGNRFGQNGGARIEYETVAWFQKPERKRGE